MGFPDSTLLQFPLGALKKGAGGPGAKGDRGAGGLGLSWKDPVHEACSMAFSVAALFAALRSPA